VDAQAAQQKQVADVCAEANELLAISAASQRMGKSANEEMSKCREMTQ
jgi:hypothetical protein